MISLVGGVIAGCSIGEQTPDEFAEERQLTCPVTYYTNGGKFKLGSDDVDGSYYTLNFKAETPILNITDQGSTTSTPKLAIGRSGYVFLGWRYCLLDENGKPVLSSDEAGNNKLNYLENGNGSADMKDNGVQLREPQKVFWAHPDPDKPAKVFGEENDIKVTIHQGEHLYLVAEWEKDVEIKYVLDIGEGKTMKVNIGETEEIWNDGDIIATKSFATFQELVLDPSKEPEYNVDIPDGKQVNVTTHSYISLYRQKNGVDPIIEGENDTYKKPKDKQDFTIYARYFEGTDWSGVRNVSEFKSILTHTGSPIRYFIVNDIDCGGKDNKGSDITVSPKGNNTFRDSIYGYGEGCTVSNIKVPLRQPPQNQEISLFGELAQNAVIKNLTIENIEYTEIQIRNSNPLHVIFSDIGGAKPENFKVEGTVTVRVTRANKNDKVAISNVQEQEGVTEQGKPTFVATDSWLGGKSFGSNQEFIGEYGGEGLDVKLYIDGKEVTI